MSNGYVHMAWGGLPCRGQQQDQLHEIFKCHKGEKFHPNVRRILALEILGHA